MNSNRPCLPSLLLVCLLFGSAGSLRSATRTWTGASPTSGNWTIPANWDGGASSPSNGDDLVFPSTAPRKVNTNNFTGFRAGSIAFTGAGGGFNLHGNSLTVSNGITGQHAGGSNALHLDLVLGDSQVLLLANATGTLGVHGNLALGPHLLTVNNRALATITGVITGTGGLAKTGTNWLYLDGASANTYSGLTTVHDGVLQVMHPQALGSTAGATRVNQEGGLRVDPSVGTLAEDLILNGWGFDNLGVLRVPGTTTFTGDINVLSNGYWTAVVNVAGGQTATFNGPVTGDGGLQKHGAGTLVFGGSAVNNPARGVTCSQGLLELRKSIAGPALGSDLTLFGGTVRVFDLSQIGAETDVTLYGDGVLDLGDLAVEDIGPIHNLAQAGGTLLTPISLLRVHGRTNLGTQFSGDISGPAAVEFRDAYQLQLHGTNTYTGPTRLFNMDLVVNGALASSSISIDGQSRLSGDGRVNHITNSGTLRPGSFDTPMTCSNLVLHTGSVFEARRWGALAPLVVRGSVRLGNASLALTTFVVWNEGETWKFIDNDGVDAVVGQFLGLPEGAIVEDGPLRARISYFGGDGNDVVLTSISTRVWDGGGADEYWTNPLNWVGNVAPLPGDNIYIPGADHQRTTNDFPAGTAFHHLRLGNGYQELHGNLLRVSGGLEWVLDSFGGQGAWIQAPIEAVADQEFVLDSAVYGDFRGGLNLGGHTVNVRCTAAINNGLSVSGSLAGFGTLQVGTNATVSLVATNSFQGAVEVQDGGNLQGSGRTLGGSAWHVAQGGSLALANGVIPGAVLAAGAHLESTTFGPGTTNIVAGDLVLQPGSSVRIFTEPNSRLIVTGLVSVAGAVLDLLPYDFQPMLGDTYVIVRNSGVDPVQGTFAGLPEGAAFHYEDAWYRISYAGGDGNDIELTLLLPPLTGTVRTWDGSGSDARWGNETNWVGNARPEAGDTLLFPVAASRKLNTNDLGFWALGGFDAVRLIGAFYDLRQETYTRPLLLQNGLVASNLTGTNILRIPFDLIHTQDWDVVAAASVLRWTAPPGASPGTVTNTVGAGVLRKRGLGRLDVESVVLDHLGGTRVEGGDLRLLDGANVTGEMRLEGGALDAVSAFSGPLLAQSGTLRLGGRREDVTGEVPNGLMVTGETVLGPGVTFSPRLDGTNEYYPTLAGSAGALVLNKGGVDLGGATLAVEVNCYPKQGDVFTIVLDLDAGGNHIANTFAGLPEGAIYQAGPWRFQIGYQGKGNRAVQLTALIRVPEFTSVAYKEGQGILEGLAEKSRPVRIEATTDFVSWTPLGVVNADANGAFSFTDLQAGSHPHRFYRAVGL